MGWIEGVAILVAVALVVLVTTVNDYQKQKQFEKLNDKKNDRSVCLYYLILNIILKHESNFPLQIKVVREGNQKQIPIADVKVGDIIIIDTGDIISFIFLFYFILKYRYIYIRNLHLILRKYVRMQFF